MAKKSKKPEKMPPELIKKILVSAIGGITLAIVVILYLAFWNPGFTLFQNLAVLLVVGLVFGAVMVATWVPWGMQFAHGEEPKWAKEKECKEKETPAGKIIGAILLSIAILYIAFWAEGWTTIQKLALIIVAFLITGASKAALWSSKQK